MSEKRYFRFSDSVLLVPFLMVLLMWTVYWAEIRFQMNFNQYGIYPRTFSGLRGLFLSPFIHGSLQHLYNNTIPIAILTAALLYFYREIAFKVLIWGTLLAGLLTWIIGRDSYHIGMSGVIYVLASFIFFKGIFTKHYRLTALSMFVVFVYGSLLWYIFPIKDGISWEGHLSGFISGLLFAVFLKAKLPETKKYDWEKEDYNEEEDEFLRHFDADGNFIETKEEIPDSGEEGESIKITYHFKQRKPDSEKQ